MVSLYHGSSYHMPRTKVYLKVVNVTPKIVSRDANNVTWLSYTADIIW